MSTTPARKPNYALPILVMFFLFAMIAFVTGFQNPFGVILKQQLGLTNFQSQLGAAANFIAYAIMGIPAGMLLQKRGYKFSAISAVLVGLLGVVIMFASSFVEGDAIFATYIVGALVAGFSMCMLNTVVNPMLNTLGGGGNKGNQLIQFGGTLNSLAATICPIFVGLLIGNDLSAAKMETARPALYVAGGIFVFAFLVLAFTKLPEPILEEQAAKAKAGIKEEKPSLKGALSFRHFTLGALAIFVYIGIEIGVPQIANLYLTAPKAPAEVAAAVAVDEYDSLYDFVHRHSDDEEISKLQGEISNLLKERAKLLNELADPAVAGMEQAAQEVATDEVAAPAEQGQPGLGMNAGIAGALVGMYWLMMLFGRLIGGAVGSKVSARAMLTVVSTAAIILLMLGIFSDPANTVSVPGFSSGEGFTMVDAPINMLYFVLCGLCTSVMWGGIFNLAVEGLGKYTAAGSGFFMVMVCGGGIILPLQAWVADAAGYLASYWVLVACAAYLLFYALIGSRVSKRAEA